MQKKRMFALLLAIIMVVSIVATACSRDNQTNTGSNTGSNNTGSQQQTNGGNDADEPLDNVTFTYFNGVAGARDVNSNETVIGKILEEQTGVNFRIEHLVGDLQTRIGTMIVGNDYPDVLIPDDAIDQILEAEAFIDLVPLIEEHAPNLKRVYEPYYHLMKTDEGAIYFLPFSATVGEYIGEPNINQGAFWIQRRVLEAYDYPEIRTVDQFFDIIERFVNDNPQEDLTGFITLTDDWRFFATTNVPNHLAGYPNDGEVIVDMDTHEARIYAGTEYDKRWFQKLNEINAKGLFDRSSFVDNYDQYIAKLTSGKVLGLFDYGWQIGNATAALRDAARQDPSQDGYRYFPLPVTFDGGKDQYLDPPSFVRNRGIGITKSADDPVRIIKFFDHLVKEETQILVKWGIEGETFERDENGRMYRTEEQIAKIDQSFNDEFGFTYFNWNWPQYGTHSSLADGNAANPGLQGEVFQMSLTDEDRKILEAYNVLTYADLFSPPDDRPWFPAWDIFKEPGSLAHQFEERKTEVQQKYIPQLVLAEPAQYDAVWDEYVAELNKLDIAGYEQFMTDEVKKIIEIVRSHGQ